MLHHVAFPGTWQMDLMFSKNNAYFVAIEVNTRYLLMKRTNMAKEDEFGQCILDNEEERIIEKKSATTIISCMEELMDEEYWNPTTLISDSEAAFKSDTMNDMIYKKYQIQHKIVYLTTNSLGHRTANHTSLAIIDRVIRTCKDYIQNEYNRERNVLPEKFVNEFVKDYNTKPHSTLCKIFKRKDVTPQMVHQNMILEMYVINYFLKLNHKRRKETKYLTIPANTIVRVYNTKDKLGRRDRITKRDPYRVIENYENNVYLLQNMTYPDKYEYAPRIWIDYL